MSLSTYVSSLIYMANHVILCSTNESNVKEDVRLQHRRYDKRIRSMHQRVFIICNLHGLQRVELIICVLLLKYRFNSVFYAAVLCYEHPKVNRTQPRESLSFWNSFRSYAWYNEVAGWILREAGVHIDPTRQIALWSIGGNMFELSNTFCWLFIVFCYESSHDISFSCIYIS